MRKGCPVRADVVHGGKQPLTTSAQPPRRGGQALHMLFLFQLSPKEDVNPNNSESDTVSLVCHFSSYLPPCQQYLSPGPVGYGLIGTGKETSVKCDKLMRLHMGVAKAPLCN